jgi:hypothetical protein
MKVTLEPRGSGKTAVVWDAGELACGHGAVVCQAARNLLYLGHDPAERLEAWRGDTKCLAGTIGAFAQLTVKETEDGPKFRKWSPSEACQEPRPFVKTGRG